MALTRVGTSHTGVNNAFASSVACASWDSVAGNILIAVAQADTVGSNGITISDNNGNTWSRVVSTVRSGAFDLEIWVAINITGRSGHIVTATDNGGGVDSTIIVEEWFDAQRSSGAADQSTGANGSSTSAASGSTGTLGQADELVVGAVAAAGSGTTVTAGSSLTNLTRINSNFSTLGMATRVVSATTAVASSFTLGTSVGWACNVATFRQNLVPKHLFFGMAG